MLCFRNPGEIDFRLITTLGVNVKEGESPIGFFGTGLKYAIAGLLRGGHSITIWSGLTKIEFTVQPQTIRGKDFGFIIMRSNHSLADQTLGFTTDLGKTWQDWMFYRELASNVMDEHGTIESGDFANFEPQAGGETIIIVTGLDQQHRDRGETFLQTKPFATTPYLEIHRRDPANGLTNYLYYRGVRVADARSPTLFNYNILASTSLTEDRTIKDMWSTCWVISRGIIGATSHESIAEIERILLAPNGSFEANELDFDVSTDNELFDATIERLMKRHLGQINQSALARMKTRRKALAPEPAIMTKVEQQQLAIAKQFLKDVLKIEVESPIVVSDSLGDGILGLATKGQIFLSRKAFARGTKYVAIVLVEEYMHAELGLDDFNREFQTWVLERMVGLGEELQGKPL